MILLDETALWDLISGMRQEPVQVGWLHPGYRRALKTTATAVWASTWAIDHIALGLHGQRYYHDLCLTPHIIYDGECRKIENNKLAFILSGYGTHHSHYKSVIKITRDYAELYLCSTHPIKPAQARKLMKSEKITKW